MPKFSLFILALIIPAGAFCATMLTTLPKTVASVEPGFSHNYRETVTLSDAPMVERRDAH
jgi:hypothetical protein